MIRQQTQSEHDALIKFAAEYLQAKGFRDIKADLAGYGLPQKITGQKNEGHIPDITAQHQHLNIFEVETADSIDDPHTADQWKLFAGYARDNDARFWVVVSAGSVMSAQHRLNDLDLKADIWGLELKT